MDTRVLKLSDIHEQAIGDKTHPVILRTWKNANLSLPSGMTHFGFSLAGNLEVHSPDVQIKLKDGGFFRIQGEGTVSGRYGFVLTVPGEKGYTQVSGPYDNVRLVEYRAGGKQAPLIWPSHVSHPTLNTLQMTHHQEQEVHSHNSLRINVIVQGSAECNTPKSKHQMSEGDVVIIPSGMLHRFSTGRQKMKFVAFHPDSDPEIFNDHKTPMELQTFGLKSSKS